MFLSFQNCISERTCLQSSAFPPLLPRVPCVPVVQPLLLLHSPPPIVNHQSSLVNSKIDRSVYLHFSRLRLRAHPKPNLANHLTSNVPPNSATPDAYIVTGVKDAPGCRALITTAAERLSALLRRVVSQTTRPTRRVWLRIPGASQRLERRSEKRAAKQRGSKAQTHAAH